MSMVGKSLIDLCTLQFDLYNIICNENKRQLSFVMAKCCSLESETHFKLERDANKKETAATTNAFCISCPRCVKLRARETIAMTGLITCRTRMAAMLLASMSNCCRTSMLFCERWADLTRLWRKNSITYEVLMHIQYLCQPRTSKHNRWWSEQPHKHTPTKFTREENNYSKDGNNQDQNTIDGD